MKKSPPVTTSLGFGITPKTKTSAPRKSARRARILIVDSEPESRRFLKARLTTAGYDVGTADEAATALDSCVRSRPNLVITDLQLADTHGLELLRELKSRWPTLTVIIITAHGTIAEAVQATQCGAFGFLVKPLEKSELLGQVQRAIAASTFTTIGGDWRAQIISRSQLMDDRLGLANRAANSSAPVLLTGENGTGKELFARAIHAGSARRHGLFVVVVCRDCSDGELDLKIESARGGTLLLEEIVNLTPSSQVHLLTALRNVCAGQDVRLICTTSVDLKESMHAGTLRQDLYYHVNVLPIEMPPLGRRREDIPLLISHFLEQATEPGDTEKIYSPEAIEVLATADWPGNVRQLFDLVKKNVALSHAKVMSKEFVQQSLGEEVKKLPSYDEARDNFARDYLTSNLQSTSGNISASARLAKRNRTDFYKLLARYRLEPDDFKRSGPGSRKKRSSDE